MMKLKRCFCGQKFNSGILWLSHIKICNEYINHKNNYLNESNLKELHINQRLPWKDIFSKYPYNNFSNCDIHEAKTKYKFPRLWKTSSGKFLSTDEINSILNYNFLYQNYIIKKLDICEIVTLLNHDFCFEKVKQRLIELNIPLRTKNEISSSDKFLEKREETCKLRYGNTHPIKLDEFKQKRSQTWLSIYNTPHPFQNIKVKNKYEKTCKERYNVSNPFSNPEIYKKSRDTLFKHGYVPSKISIKLFDDLRELFPSIQNDLHYLSHNGEVIIHDNIKKTKYCLDFSYNQNDTKFDIEFNGDYYHMNPEFYKETDIAPFPNTKIKTAKDIWNYDSERKQFLESLGYKVMIVWENDYRNKPQDVLKKCISFINETIDHSK